MLNDELVLVGRPGLRQGSGGTGACQGVLHLRLENVGLRDFTMEMFIDVWAASLRSRASQRPTQMVKIQEGQMIREA